jgi:hypothetical protein
VDHRQLILPAEVAVVRVARAALGAGRRNYSVGKGMEKAEREAELLRIENGEARTRGGHGRPSVADERRMPAMGRPVPTAARTWRGRG